MRFDEGAIVEQVNLGDLPFRVVEARDGTIPRYTLHGIDGSSYENIPEYMMAPARPPSESKWGATK